LRQGNVTTYRISFVDKIASVDKIAFVDKSVVLI